MMDDLSIWDFAFAVVTTLALGALTVAQFVIDGRRRQFEDTQIALDIVAGLTSQEILSLLQKPRLSVPEHDFLFHMHGVSLDRQSAMRQFHRLRPEIRKSVVSALERVFAAIGSDPRARERQEQADSKFHTTVASSIDRTKYTWGDSGERLGKWDILALAGARWLREHPEITTREQFDTEFGNLVRPVLEPILPGAKFDSDLLLDRVVSEGQREAYARRGQKWLDSHRHDGVIELDEQQWRIGWKLGFSGSGGGSAHLALIEYFRTTLGYDIQAI